MAKGKRFCGILKQGGYDLRLPIRLLTQPITGCCNGDYGPLPLAAAGGDMIPDYPDPVFEGRPSVRDAIG